MSYSLDYDDPESVRALLTRCGFRSRPTDEPGLPAELEKQRALRELQREHDMEMDNLFNYLQEELAKSGKAYNDKIAHLQDELDRSRSEISTADKAYFHKVVHLQEKLEESNAEVHMLREKLDESNAELKTCRHQLDESRSVEQIFNHKMAVLQEKLDDSNAELADMDKKYCHKLVLMQDKLDEVENDAKMYSRRLDECSHEMASLQDELDQTRDENEYLRDRLDQSHAGSAQVEDELRWSNSELMSTSQRTSELENEVAMLRMKMREQQEEMSSKRKEYLSEIESKNKEISTLKHDLLTIRKGSDATVLGTKEAMRKFNRSAIANHDMEIQKLRSESLASVKKLYAPDAVDTVNVDRNKKWEVESELTHEHDYESRKENKRIQKKPGSHSSRQAPLSSRSNKLPSPTYLSGEEISLSYSHSNDELERKIDSPKVDIWSDTKKGIDNSLSKRLERMYCKK